MTQFLEYLASPAPPNIVESKVEACRIRWENGTGTAKDYIAAQAARDKAVNNFEMKLPEFSGLSCEVDQWCQLMLDHWDSKRGLSFSREVQIRQIWRAFGKNARKRIGSFAPQELAAKHFTTWEYLEAIMETFVNKRTREEAQTKYEQRIQLPGESVVEFFRAKQTLMILAIPVSERSSRREYDI